jgi:hypothetical protein
MCRPVSLKESEGSKKREIYKENERKREGGREGEREYPN